MRLLVVEDEPDFLRTLAQALREEGFAVDEAADGEEGLYKAREWDYAAIVLDVMLPRLDGFEVLRRLRERKQTPVLMLTARSQVGDRIRGLDGGADDYLGKPVDLNELAARVRALIRRSAGQANSVVEIDGVRIDLAAHRVAKNGAMLELTAREIAVLELLALRRGQIVTRTDFYDHLHDEMESPLSNLVDVHVSNLRKKLGTDFITTHRGLGYSIGA